VPRDSSLDTRRFREELFAAHEAVPGAARPAPLRVCVLGAAGYIGSRLCQALAARGHALTAVDLLWFGNGLAPAACAHFVQAPHRAPAPAPRPATTGRAAPRRAGACALRGRRAGRQADYESLPRAFWARFDAVVCLAAHSSVKMALGSAAPCAFRNNVAKLVRLAEHLDALARAREGPRVRLVRPPARRARAAGGARDAAWRGAGRGGRSTCRARACTGTRGARRRWRRGM